MHVAPKTCHFFLSLFILRKRERETVGGGGREREREKERERIPSKFHAVSTEPNAGLNPTTLGS